MTRSKNIGSYERFVFLLLSSAWRILEISFLGLRRHFCSFVLLALFEINAIGFFPKFFEGILEVKLLITFLFVLNLVIFFVLGVREFLEKKKFRDAIDDLELQKRSGKKPALISVKEKKNGNKVISIYSGGFGVDRFRAKESDLSASLDLRIQEIRSNSKRPSIIEIEVSQSHLLTFIKFKDIKIFLKKPYDFLIGVDENGPLVENLLNLPHMFIAGTTGGGKSVFFNNVIISLLNSSKFIQFYLIDLKKGLEVRDYKDFPGIETLNEETEILRVLEEVDTIMDERFEDLEKEGKRKIDPERDNKNVIIVAFDEVSEVFDVTIKDKAKKEQRHRIFEKVHRISKLGRAAGIHLIFATQKIKKQLFPTEIQTNIGGRMCFKLPTTSDSVTAIGNKMAYDLPAISGRGVWQRGNKYHVVQAPFLTNEDIEEEVNKLRGKFMRDKAIGSPSEQSMERYKDFRF